MTVYSCIIVSAALAVTQGSTTPPSVSEGGLPGYSNNSLLYTLLQVAGFSETCVSGVINYCSSAQEEAHYPSLIQELEENKAQLQEVKEQLHEVKEELQEGKVKTQGVKKELHEVKEEIHEGKMKSQEVKEELQEVKEELQEVKEELQEGKVKTQEVKEMVQQELQENKAQLQEVKEQLHEVKEQLQEGKVKTQEVKEMVQQEMHDVKGEVQEVKEMLQQVVLVLVKNDSLPRHCKDLLDSGDSGSGLRQVFPNPEPPNHPVTVYCDQEVDGGGWTVFQRRVNNSVRQDFLRSWREYQAGFGDIRGEFWLGLDHLHELASTEQELRIDLYDYEGQHRWAKYDTFQVGPEDTNYRLTVGRYSGDAGDAMTYHNGQEFSTHDADHDMYSGNCAEAHRGAWWYNVCDHSNLNGYQYVGVNSPGSKGIVWYHWRGNKYSLMRTTMMLRPAP